MSEIVEDLRTEIGDAEIGVAADWLARRWLDFELERDRLRFSPMGLFYDRRDSYRDKLIAARAALTEEQSRAPVLSLAEMFEAARISPATRYDAPRLLEPARVSSVRVRPRRVYGFEGDRHRPVFAWPIEEEERLTRKWEAEFLELARAGERRRLKRLIERQVRQRLKKEPPPMPEPTPGLWRFRRTGTFAPTHCVFAPDTNVGESIADVHGATAEQAEARARLIAAAPDLFAACKSALDYLSYVQSACHWPGEKMPDEAALTAQLETAIAMSEGWGLTDG